MIRVARKDSPLRVFTNEKFMAPGLPPLVMLAGSINGFKEDPKDPDTGRFDLLFSKIDDLIQVTSAEQSEVFLYPSEWRESAQPYAAEMDKLARKGSKKLVVLFNSDSDQDIPLNNSIVFRTSFYQSRRKAWEHALPAWSADPVPKYFGGALPVRQKSNVPIVSYCGYVHGLVGADIRLHALSLLDNHPGVQLNVIARPGFWGHAAHPSQPNAAEIKRSTREEYIMNMASGDYALCARGAGNFSYRFYEAMSMGRIPVFVDSDSVLPFDQYIDWDSLIVRVKIEKFDTLPARLVAHHESLSAAEFEAKQQKCRRVWEEWLSPVGFIKGLTTIIRHSGG